MSTQDFRAFLDPAAAVRIDKAGCRVDLFDYPPPLERLLGVWGPLSREPFKGITADGMKVEGLFSLAPSGAPVAAAAQAAQRWLASLPTDVRVSMRFPVDSDLWRHWQNTPLILRNPQVELLELSQAQRELALEVVRASLSSTGYARVREVMANNLFMGELIDMTDVLNDWAFTLSIFGEPSTEGAWGWQLFGHHLALSCLFLGEQMVLSPIFMGLEPDHDHGGRGRRMFEPHEMQALDLMRSLTDRERERAVLYASMLTADQPAGRFHPDDGRQVGGAFQDNRVVPYEGVPVGALDRAQRSRVLGLAELFVENLPDGPAVARLSEIERYLDTTHFAWIGQANDVDPFYFRIHSPVALIEFDHHSGIFLANREPERFHVHSIVRTPNGGDYGADLLRQHYERGGHGRDPAGHAHGAHEHDPHTHSHDGGRTFHRHD